MKIQIQTGIDATKFQNLMHQIATAGYECQAHAERKKHAERLKLLGKQCERMLPAQGDLFGGEES